MFFKKGDFMVTFEEIDSYLEKGIALLDAAEQPQELYNPIRYILSIGGKRIRPKLCLLTYSLFKDTIDDAAIYPALGLEIFHEFTLIHDDIMDKSDMRRGMPTVHKKWNDNIAILSGDVMSILAYKYMAKAPVDKLPEILKLFTTTAIQICEGQQYDMNFETAPIVTIDEYMEMIGLKTAVLIACSAKMGAIAAGASTRYAEALYSFGYNLGIAFQITDDYLDTFGDPAIFGKKIGGDIVNNKKSWLNVECTRIANGEDAQNWKSICSMGADEAQAKIDAAKELYIKLGIKEKAEKEIEKYYSKALSELETLPISEEQLEQLHSYARKITFRDK